MRIASVCYKTPSKEYSIEDTLEIVERDFYHLGADISKQACRKVRALLRKSGACTRYGHSLGEGAMPSDMINSVLKAALNKADLDPAKVDLLIYCGVGRGFIEPANAYFYAKACGLKRAECFDISDACMSWVRALHVAYQFLQTGSYNNVVVINGEFHNGIRNRFKPESLDDLTYVFPLYTIGEAATATVLELSEQKWNFKYLSLPEHSNLCTIPLYGYDRFVEDKEKLGLNGIGNFASFGEELLQVGRSLLFELFQENISALKEQDLFIPHAPDKSMYEAGAGYLGVAREKLFAEVFPRFGNLASASIPVGLCLAEEKELLKRGTKTALVPASAGAVGAFVHFVY